MAQHKVPTKNWKVVAVDLFGPKSSSNHAIVLQDLGPRYPAAKFVCSTKAEKIIPTLKEINSYYGNPEIQIFDSGPAFNSKQMDAFANENNIKLQKIALQHPSSNPSEIFMQPLGKPMKNSSHEQKLRKRDSGPITKQL